MSVTVTLFDSVDVDAVHPVSSLLGKSKVTMFINVNGGASNDPSAVITTIVGAGVNVIFCVSLQSCPSLCTCQ
jgi:hypothetical protein